MRYLYTLLLLIALGFLTSCEKAPADTVFKGTVLRDSDDLPVTDATLLFSAVGESTLARFIYPNILENYDVQVDSTGAFELVVPGEFDGEETYYIGVLIITDDGPDGPDAFSLNETDVVLEGSFGDVMNSGEFDAGSTYDFTIRLLR
ncbi:MAG: hypothetical protein AB8F78_15420 [Saprospiraceae bacterium]